MLNLQTTGPDPDPVIHVLYGWVGLKTGRLLQPRNRQADRGAVAHADVQRRKQLLWEIQRRLAEENARPMIFYSPSGTCLRPHIRASR